MENLIRYSERSFFSLSLPWALLKTYGHSFMVKIDLKDTRCDKIFRYFLPGSASYDWTENTSNFVKKIWFSQLYQEIINISRNNVRNVQKKFWDERKNRENCKIRQIEIIKMVQLWGQISRERLIFLTYLAMHSPQKRTYGQKKAPQKIWKSFYERFIFYRLYRKNDLFLAIFCIFQKMDPPRSFTNFFEMPLFFLKHTRNLLLRKS